jgi:Carboxypeptidase regulatory-like domain
MHRVFRGVGSLANWPGTRLIALAGALAAVLLSTTGNAAAAQAIRVRAIDAVSGTPLAGALIAALSLDGAVVRERIADAQGGALLSTRGDSVRIRVRRVGYVPYLSEPIAVTGNVALATTVRVPARHVALPRVTVTASAKDCRRTADERAGSGVLWDQIRTALDAALLTRSDSLVREEVTAFTRVLDRGGAIVEARTVRIGTSGSRPFFAENPATLSRLGWVQDGADSTSFFAPSAEVLLSQEFATDHCFGLVAGARATAGLVGLTVDPIVGRKLPDIRGTLWVDSTTQELRFFEFTYVHVALPRNVRGVGGRIEFERLPSGAWIERYWVIQMPRFRSVADYVAFDGYLEEGARADAVMRVRPILIDARDAVTPVTDRRGRIAGIVYDSALGAPIASATVSLPALERWTKSDASGRFTFDSLPIGGYDVEAEHVSLDSVGVKALRTRVEVGAEQAMLATLSVPSFTTINDGRCADTTGIVKGIVQDFATGKFVGGATVTISWVSGYDIRGDAVSRLVSSVQAPTTRDGRFFACVPLGASLTAAAMSDGAGSDRVPITLGPRRVTAIDLIVRRGRSPRPPD